MPSVAGSNVPEFSTSPVASSSMIVVGVARPPGPTSVTGTGTPAACTVTCGAVSSVVVRLTGSLPGRNSATVPSTSTSSPTFTVGVELVNTNRPSLVAGSESGVGSCIQKPLLRLAVTMPWTSDTASPSSGDWWAAPWISLMVLTGGGGGGSDPEFCGSGALAVKSAELLSVSVPSAPRLAEVVFDRPGAGAVSNMLVAEP